MSFYVKNRQGPICGQLSAAIDSLSGRQGIVIDEHILIPYLLSLYLTQ